MPAGAGNALQALVSRLRRALPEAVIESRPAGYQLKIDPRSTNIVRFEDLVAAGRAQLRDDPAAAGQTLRQALALWRGPALADVADTDFGQAAIARLDELRLTAIEQRVDADLRTGNTASLVAELEGLVIAHPMREPLAARLMRALHAAGRRGAALEVYEQTRKRLVNQLGVEPSAELAALHLDILRDEPPAEPDPRPPARPSRQQPRQPRTHQPARRAHQLRRPRRRAPAGRRAARRVPPDHARPAPAARARPGWRSRRPGPNWAPCPTGCGWWSWPRSPTLRTSPPPC